MKRIIAAMIVAACALVFGVFLAGMIATAFARPPAGVTLDPQVHAWFESLQNPATGISCCGHSDGHIMDLKDIRNDGNTWQVRIDGHWYPVPPEAVLDRVDNPTGSFVVFWNEYSRNEAPAIFCFVRPAMT